METKKTTITCRHCGAKIKINVKGYIVNEYLIYTICPKCKGLNKVNEEIVDVDKQ